LNTARSSKAPFPRQTPNPAPKVSHPPIVIPGSSGDPHCKRSQPVAGDSVPKTTPHAPFFYSLLSPSLLSSALGTWPGVAVRGAHLAPSFPNPTPSRVLPGPSHPLPKREGPLPFALDLPIFRGEPVAEAAGLQPTPRRVAPQTAPPGPGSFGTGAGGQPGAMVWPLRTNYAARRGMGQMTGSMNAELRTPPVTPPGVWRWRSWRGPNHCESFGRQTKP